MWTYTNYFNNTFKSLLHTSCYKINDRNVYFTQCISILMVNSEHYRNNNKAKIYYIASF